LAADALPAVPGRAQRTLPAGKAQLRAAGQA
jgi:hypothetical protein